MLYRRNVNFTIILFLAHMRRDDSTVKPEMQKHNIDWKCMLIKYQSNYSSRIVFSHIPHIPIEFGQTGISAIQSADPENPILEPNTK